MNQLRSFFKTRLGQFFTITLLLFGSFRVYYQLTDDFRLSNISIDLSHRKEWETEPLSQSETKLLDQILKQKFTYLGKGAQSYVFKSNDNQYVIKFFKFKHLRPSFYLQALPSLSFLATYKEGVAKRKARKLNDVFQGYHTAYELHKDEAGLIYIHLNKSNHLNTILTVYDKLGRSHQIDLDQYVFLVQKKGETLQTVIKSLLKNQKIDLAKDRIHQILDLYVAEYKKGIYDFDHGVLHNTGFIDQKPIHLDVGKLKREEKMKDPSFYKQDLEIVYKKIDHWLQKNFPVEYEKIAQDLHQKYEALLF